MGFRPPNTVTRQALFHSFQLCPKLRGDPERNDATVTDNLKGPGRTLTLRWEMYSTRAMDCCGVTSVCGQPKA